MDCSKLAKNTKNDNVVTILRHDVIVNLFWRFFVSIVKFSYWSKFHVNIITGSGITTIFFYKGLTRNPEIGNKPVWVLPNIWRLGWVTDTKFDTNISNRMLLNAAKCQVTAFNAFELLTKNWGGGGKITPPPPRLGLELKQINKQKEKMELILYFIIKHKGLWNYIQLKNCENVYISLTSCFQDRQKLRAPSQASFAYLLNATCMILHIQIYLAYSPSKRIKTTIRFEGKVPVCLWMDLILLKCASLYLNCTHALLFRNTFWLDFQSFWTSGFANGSSAICQKVRHSRDQNQDLNFF